MVVSLTGVLERRTVPRGLFRRPGRPFSPADIAGLKTWLAAGEGLFLDTARTTPATLENAQVAAWADKSGQGNHLTQATAGNRPTLKLTEGLNGYSALRFTRASSQYLSGPTLTLAQPNTMFIVAKVIGGSGATNHLVGSTTAVQNALYVVSGGNLRIYDGATEQASAGTYVDDWHTFGHLAKADPDLAYVDGVQVISGASGSDALGGVRLGANVTPSGFLGGWVLEVLVYNAQLTAGQIAQVFTFLDGKFGISGVAPLSTGFTMGPYDDLNVHDATTFTAMLDDMPTFGADGVTLTNGNTTDLEMFLTIADVRGVPVDGAPLNELNANSAADLTPLAGKLRRHRSLRSYFPLRDEPPASDASAIAGWVSSLRTIDPRRPSGVMLIGTERVQTIYDAAQPGVLPIDVYPCGLGRSEMDFTMSGFGYPNLDMESYVKLVTQSKRPTTPLWITLQAHGLAAVDLRSPTIPEIRRQFWEAIGLGTNDIRWFPYTSQQGWTGIKDNPAVKAELLALSANLTPAVRSALRGQVRCGDEWAGTNGVKVYTTASLNADGTALGDWRYVTVVNRTTGSVTTTLSALLGPGRILTRITDGVVTNTVTLPAGGGAIFVTTPQTQAAGVPDVPIDWTMTPSARWAAHPLNPANGAYVVATHPVAATLNPGDSIQTAIDALPLGPATIVLNGPGNYVGFNIYGRNNLHIVAPNGATITTPGGTTDYKDPTVRIGPAADTLVAPGGYAAYNAGVDAASNSPIPWVDYFHRPVTDVYLKGITFDGGSKIVRPVTMTSVRRVMFDGCTFQNLLTSAQITTQATALGDGLAGFHYGSVDANTRVEQVSFRGCTFTGPGRWGIYLDGSHGAVIVGCTFAGSNYGAGCWVALNNDDFSYSDTLPAHVATTNDEKRSAMYGVFANNTVTGSIDAILSYSGGSALVKDNTINSVHIAFGFTARGSNKWGPAQGLIYYHFGNQIIGNTIATVVAGPENGAQGIVYLGASHCGVDNSPSGSWASPQGRPIWGRIGSGVDPLVPGVTKQLVIRGNVVASGPAGLVLKNDDNVPGEPGPAGTVEGAGSHDISGNTRAGLALT